MKLTFDGRGWKWAGAAAVFAGVLSAGLAWAQQRSGPAAPARTALTALDFYEIQQLGARYAYGLDTGADNGYYYANVFTPDGSFGATSGRENLAALARDGGGRLKLKGYYHVVSNVVVEPTADGAAGHQYIQVLTIGGQGKAPAVDHGGRYEDTYVRTPDGWRIKSRRYVQMFPPQ
jgi:hypothetical protein